MAGKKRFEITERDVIHYFGNTLAGRGSDYQRAGLVDVVSYDPEFQLLVALVQGSRSTPYKVKVEFGSRFKVAVVRCSCPMAGFCKHSAAAVYQIIRSGLLDSSGSEASSSAPLGVSSSSPSSSSSSSSSSSTSSPSNAQDDSPLSSRLSNWLSHLEDVVAAKADTASSTKKVLQVEDLYYDRVHYCLSLDSVGKIIAEPVVGIKYLHGGWSRSHRADLDRIVQHSASYADETDRMIAGLILSVRSNYSWMERHALPEIPELAKLLITKMVSTGRCFWKSFSNDPLSLAPPKKGRFIWKADKNGKQSLKVAASGEAVVGLGGGAWYIEPETCVIGTLEMPVPDGALKTILSAPGIEPAQVASFSNALSRLTKDIPPPVAAYQTETILVEAKPVLNLTMMVQDRYYSSKAAPPEAYAIVKSY